jgi:hypothetical protein
VSFFSGDGSYVVVSCRETCLVVVTTGCLGEFMREKSVSSAESSISH